MNTLDLITAIKTGQFNSIKHQLTEQTMLNLVKSLEDAVNRANALHVALTNVANTIEVSNNLENGPITDTIWLQPVDSGNIGYLMNTTLVDYIDSELLANLHTGLHTHKPSEQLLLTFHEEVDILKGLQ